MADVSDPAGRAASADSKTRATTAILRQPRKVPLDAPWEWLAAGWRDLLAMPGVGLSYGVLFAGGALALCYALLRLGAGALFPMLAGGFLLIAPLLAVGLYQASRMRAAGGRPGFGGVALAGLEAKGQLLFFGVGLMIAFLIWLELALILLMLFMGGQGLPAPEQLLPTLLFTWRGLGLLVVGTGVGAILAATVFSISVVAVPMLLAEPVDTVTAVRSSLAAVRANPGAMALWATLIAMMIAAGFATLLAGLVVAFPLIGHATWHAYDHIYGEGGRK